LSVGCQRDCNVAALICQVFLFIMAATGAYASHPAKRQPELPQELPLGHEGALSPLLFIYAGADLYTVSMSVELQCGQGMRLSVFSAMVAFTFDSLSQFKQRRS